MTQKKDPTIQTKETTKTDIGKTFIKAFVITTSAAMAIIFTGISIFMTANILVAVLESKTANNLNNMANISTTESLVAPGTIKRAAATVYLEYNKAKTDGGSTGIIYVYQPVKNAPTTASPTNRKWVRSKIYQYSEGGSWDNDSNTLGNLINDVTGYNFAPSSANWSFNNGTGSSTWNTVTAGAGLSYKKFDPSDTNYTQYSAYAQTKLTQNAQKLMLGYLYTPTLGGTYRVKINGIIQANRGNLNANGELNSSMTPSWYYDKGSLLSEAIIGVDVKKDDIVTIELKGGADGKDRAYLYGIKYAMWQFTDQYQIEPANTTVTMVASITLNSEDGGFIGYCNGPAHHNHENRGLITEIIVDGVSYRLDDNLKVGDIISGNNVSIKETNNIYGTASPTNAHDFADITRTFRWVGSDFTRAWSITFKKEASANPFYIAALNSDLPGTGGMRARYWGISNDTYIQMPTDNTITGFDILTDGENSNVLSYGYGDIGLKETLVSQNTAKGFQSGHSSRKLYLRKDSWAKKWLAGETASNSATITYSYELPQNMDWTGKTLIMAKSDTISNSTALLPFQGKGNYIKFYPGTGLNFNGFMPTNTYFTSINDTSVGAKTDTSTGNPAKGNWLGLTIIGPGNSTNNTVKYAATGMTLTGQSNANNNTISDNNIGLNIATGSSENSNIFSNNATNTVSAGN